MCDKLLAQPVRDSDCDCTVRKFVWWLVWRLFGYSTHLHSFNQLC
jgi:hypothetical protein